VILPTRRLRSLVCIVAMSWATQAWPHATQLSSARLVLDGRTVRATLELDARDVDAALTTAIADASGGASSDAALRHAEGILALVKSGVALTLDRGIACTPSAGQVGTKAGHVVVALDWSCPPSGGELAYVVSLFHDIDPASKHVVTLTGDATRLALLSAGAPRVVLATVESSAPDVAWRYAVTGVEHIALGWDHIAFVIAVILWGRGPWPVVRVVTAFTVAHSITLVLSVLDMVRVPSRPVEVLIALSIVYVAAENFFMRDIGRRWRLTFLFGLVHGLGFAGALREFGLPADAIGLALAAFNVGVEIGQIAIVLAGLAVLAAADRARGGVRDPRLVHALSAVLLVCGMFWAVQRSIS
jgi:hydrogenase/urease accessory protein HupE